MFKTTLALLVPITALAIGLVGPSSAEDRSEHSDFAKPEDATPFEQEVTRQCSFALECFDGEGCAETLFEPELTGKAGGPDDAAMVVDALLISDAGDVPLLGVLQDRAMSLSGGGIDARHLMTITSAGDARYTVHFMDGPMMISYAGRCE